MNGLDTNVLVRYLVQDDPAQSQRAAKLIEGAAEAGDRLLLSCIVLCELVWVLEDCYDATRKELLEVLERILATTQFEIEHKDCTRAALEDFRAHRADFSDCLVGRVNRALGCQTTFSFDKATRSITTFSPP